LALFFGGILWGFHRYGLFTRYCGRDPFEIYGKKKGKEGDASTSNNETENPTEEIEANYKETALVGANMVTPNEDDAAPEGAFNVYTMTNDAATMASTITTDTTIPPDSQGSSTITATVDKASREEKLGIGLSRDLDGVFSISRILPESPFHKTDLAIGMVVKSINGMDITGEEKGFPKDILKGTVGQVTIVAEKSKATDESWSVPPPERRSFDRKDSGNADVETNNKEMVVEEGEETQKGDAEAFNFYTMADSAAAMASTILCGGTDTTIPADSQTTTLTNTITATVTKTSQEEKLGLSLVRSVEGIFSVSRLSSESLFHKTDLAIGMVVKSVNGMDITGEESGFPTDILKGSVGQVTIVAEKADANAEAMA
jgi:hypothetical protein